MLQNSGKLEISVYLCFRYMAQNVLRYINFLTSKNKDSVQTLYLDLQVFMVSDLLKILQTEEAIEEIRSHF